ncbi:MAG: adenylate/guanylate cyclase domain-containing protein, partial [Nitrososphaeraceae archaeon]
GYTISIVIKMTSLAKPDHIVIGEELFGMLEGKLKDVFKQLSIPADLWSYSAETTGKIYSVYENISDK